jgi:hypothetical protein
LKLLTTEKLQQKTKNKITINTTKLFKQVVGDKNEELDMNKDITIRWGMNA